jgi:hypothetical protein
MKKLKKTLIALAKIYPNDAVFGEEVRKIVWEMSKKKFEKQKKSWDKLKTTEDFLRVMDKRKNKINENN